MGVNSVGYNNVSSYYDQLYASQTNSAASSQTVQSFDFSEAMQELSSSNRDGGKSSQGNGKISLNMNGMNAMNRMQGPPPPPPGGGKPQMKDPASMTDDEVKEVQSNMVKMYNSMKASGEDVSSLTDVSGKSVSEMKDFLTQMNKEREAEKNENNSSAKIEGGHKKAAMKDPSKMSDEEISAIQKSLVETYNSLKDSGEDVSSLTDVSGKSVSEMKDFLTELNSAKGNNPPPPPPGGGRPQMKDASSMSDDEVNSVKEKMTSLYNTFKDSGKDVSSLTDVSNKSTDEMRELLTKMQQERMTMISKYNQNISFGSNDSSGSIQVSA